MFYLVNITRAGKFVSAIPVDPPKGRRRVWTYYSTITRQSGVCCYVEGKTRTAAIVKARNIRRYLITENLWMHYAVERTVGDTVWEKTKNVTAPTDHPHLIE